MKKIYLFLAFIFVALATNLHAQCDSDAGMMSPNTLTDCGEGSINVPASTGTFLEDDDTLFYALHDSSTDVLGTILAISPNSDVIFQGTLETGVIYYLSAVVGNTTGIGTFDLDDPCLSVAPGTPVVFEELIDFVIPDVVLGCQGEGGIFDCVIPDGYTVIFSDGSTTCPWLVPGPGIYSLTIVSPYGCTMDVTFAVDAPAPIDVIIENPGELNCENQEISLFPTVTGGSPPYTFNWNNGINGDMVITSFPGIYCVEVTDVNGCIGNACIDIVANYEDCSSIEGTITKDEDNNCAVSIDETPLAGRMILAESTEGNFYGYTNDEGKYYIPAPVGTYQVQVINPAPIVWQSCPTQEVIVEDTDIALIADFALQPILDCPLLSVDLSTWVLRPCFDVNYAVNYCNEGTVAAENAYIDVIFDELITVNSSTAEYTNPEPNLYRFDLGTLDIGTCGLFLIEVQMSCDAELGQTVCNQAVIYPHEPCSPDPNWNGASVKVTGDCNGDEVSFNLENIGTANMETPSGYIVIEDGVMLSTEPIDFELDAGEILPLSFPANGSTYTVQVMQVAGHPGFSAPTSSVEACGTNEDGEVSQGFILQFPLDENDNWISEDCRVVTGSYDPNDKAGSPRGYGENHYIDKGQDIEYLIRFQNTGTDTAFLVRIDDVLAPELDITTLRAGASSHPYELNIRGADTLEFLFENILLPDSFVNEVASHGFVQFKVSQREGLEYGTIIENTAGIYFDFNEAIITNTTFHELGEAYVEVTSAQNVIMENLQAEISPNPVMNEFTLSLSGVDFKEGRLEVYDVSGKLIKTEIFNDKTSLIRKNNNAEGLYFYKIYLDNEFAASGKLVFVR